jgi:transposase
VRVPLVVAGRVCSNGCRDSMTVTRTFGARWEVNLSRFSGVPADSRIEGQMGTKKRQTKDALGPRFSDEAKAEAIAALVRGDVDSEGLARGLGVSTRSLRRWRNEIEDAEARQPLTKEERRKLRELERENQQLKLENEILKKARTFSAKHRS